MNYFAKRFPRILLAIFVLGISLPALAQASSGDIHFQLSTQAAVPGHLLAPGQYVFHRMSAYSPNTYQVLNSDGGQFVGFFQVVPTERAQVGAMEVRVAMDDAGVSRIQSWYAPGDTNGYAFVYSTDDLRRLDQIAQAHGQATGSEAGAP